MTKLECSVKNCLHNADNCCCKAAIAVDGNKAKTAEQTCCASFDENKEASSPTCSRPLRQGWRLPATQ